MKPWLPEAQGPDSTPSEPRQRGARQLYVPSSADLAYASIPKRWVVLCFAVTFLFYAAFVPHVVKHSNPPTGDQPFYLMDVISLVQDGDLNVKNNYDNRDFDQFYRVDPGDPNSQVAGEPYPLPKQLASPIIRPPTEEYAFHLPGLALLLVPSWIAGLWFSVGWPATVVFMCIIGALVALNVFLLAYEVTGRTSIAVAVWLPIAFSNPIMSYSYLLFTELTTGLLLIYAFRRLALGWGANGRWRLALLGLCIGYIPLLAWRCAPIAAMLCLYATIQWWRYRRASVSRTTNNEALSEVGQSSMAQITNERGQPGNRVMPPSISSLVLLLMPVVISGLLIIGYNMFLFGKPLPDTKVPELGNVNPFHWPWQSMEDLTFFVTSAFAHLFDRQMGLLTNAPIYLLAVVGMIAMFRSTKPADRRLLAGICFVILPYLGLIIAFHFWNGIWCPPARYPTTLVPLTAAPLAMSLYVLSGSWLYKVVYGMMALPGLLIMAMRLDDPSLLWPVNSIFGWLHASPHSPVQGRLVEIQSVRHALPSFSPLDDLRLPADTAWMIAFSATVVMVCYFVMQSRGRFIVRRLPLATQGLFWSAALLALGSAWFVMNRVYLEPRTILVEQKRWDLGVQLVQPLGIAYLDGKIYTTDYRGGKVGVLDLATGSYNYLAPTSAQGAVGYAQPGDIKVGPDGLLYLLNNGPDNHGLYVMKPDGEVVRQVYLAGKTSIATGLYFGPAGEIYVADMTAGRVHKYDSNSRLVADLGAAAGGFGNLSSVVVNQDGTIYATDLTNQVIKKLDTEGKLLATYPVKCDSWAMTLKDDWLDLTCGDGLTSVNTKTGHIQKSRTSEGKPPLQAPTGLTYGPENKLYLIDHTQIIEYVVER